MAKRVNIEDSWTRETIDELITNPPVNEVELQKRLESVEKTLARRITVDMLDRSVLPDRAGPLFLAVMGFLGVGHQKRRLTRIALDQGRGAKERLYAAMTVTSENPGTMEALLEELGPDGMGVLVELSLFELLEMQNVEDIGTPIATTLENLVQNNSLGKTLVRIEAYRQGIGVTCAEAYKESLKRSALASIRKEILNLIVDDGSENGVLLLSTLRDETSDQVARRDFQSALLKLRSHRIDPKRSRNLQRGTAYLSNCDGQGDFIVLGCLKNPDDTTTMADLCIRADGELRDGTVYARRSEDEVKGLKEKIKNQLGCYFAKIPLEVAAAIVGRAASESEVTDDARQAVSIFERISNSFDDDLEEETIEVDPDLDLSVETVRELFSRPEYDDTWFFDSVDLNGFDMELPAPDEDNATWIGKALQSLAKSSITDRLVAMFSHMARWHFWMGELREASLCKAASLSVSGDVNSSSFVLVMLERSLEAVRDAIPELSDYFRDISTRERLKEKFFGDVVSPKGRDLATLDFVEATASALGAAFELLPEDRCPGEETRDLTAFELGKIFAEHIVSEEPVFPDYTVPRMSEALASICKLNESERHQVIMTVVPSLYSFVEEICSVCHVNCLRRPNGDVLDVFSKPHHPLSPERFES